MQGRLAGQRLIGERLWARGLAAANMTKVRAREIPPGGTAPRASWRRRPPKLACPLHVLWGRHELPIFLLLPKFPKVGWHLLLGQTKLCMHMHPTTTYPVSLCNRGVQRIGDRGVLRIRDRAPCLILSFCIVHPACLGCRHPLACRNFQIGVLEPSLPRISPSCLRALENLVLNP